MALRGRPRSFDRDAALRSAMNVFWRRGYDGASLEELLRAMGGITPPSFYAAFGSKEELFLEVIQLYQRSSGSAPARALETSPVKGGVEAMLRAAVDQFDNSAVGRGCLLVLGAPTRTKTNAGVHERLRDMRCQVPELLEKRLRRAVADGELPATAPVADIAAFFATVMHGLAVQARDGASRQTMLAVVDGAMGAWDTLVSGGTARRATARKRPRPTARTR
ncbi:MAG: TetR/AcrR family transcriptional regulator [Geminicoccaceae bacterium]|nr:TetR/AcrR family transcriptional regulator [Geminicoccaceae bacterium]